MHALADVGESSEVDGHYGPWMVVSRRAYGMKRTNLGVSTNSTNKSTWHSSFHLPQRNLEWGSTLTSGPTAIQSFPRKDAKPKEGVYPKRGSEKWALKPSVSMGVFELEPIVQRYGE